MKKLILCVFILILAAGSLSAGTGAISVSPRQVPRGYYGATLTVDFNADAATIWTAGKLYFVFPEAFYPAPTTVTATQGNIRVYRMVGGVTPVEMLSSDIMTDGYAVTINAIALSANDRLKIVYGYIENAGEGLQTPNVPGDYYILCGENPTGVSVGTSVPSAKVKVSDVAITKTVNKTDTVFGDTLVYNITFSNINPIHSSTNVSVWDSIPQGFEVIGTSYPPNLTTGNMLMWDIGNMAISEPYSVSVTARVKDNALNWGAAVTNTAEIKANDMYTNSYYEKASAFTAVKGVSLTANIVTLPSSYINTGGQITVLMSVYNTGNTVTPYAAANVVPTNPNVTLLAGPLPPSRAIDALMSGTFTWIYTANSSGNVAFSAYAAAQSGYVTVYSPNLVSNTLLIMDPTATYTSTMAIPTGTSTAVPTGTFTAVPTDTATALPTATYTYTAIPSSTSTTVPSATGTTAATDVPTNTPDPTATYTKTPVPAGSATPVPQLSPSRTPDVPVYTSRNIFNPEKGEALTIAYKLPYSSKVRVWIYNLNGEVVAELKNEEESGSVSVTWDGKNFKGKNVARGIYFIHIKQGDWQVIRKLIVIK